MRLELYQAETARIATEQSACRSGLARDPAPITIARHRSA